MGSTSLAYQAKKDTRNDAGAFLIEYRRNYWFNQLW